MKTKEEWTHIFFLKKADSSIKKTNKIGKLLAILTPPKKNPKPKTKQKIPLQITSVRNEQEV